MGQTWGPVGPRWAPAEPREPCYLSTETKHAQMNSQGRHRHILYRMRRYAYRECQYYIYANGEYQSDM